MSTQTALLDVDKLKITNWENFIKNNEDIIFYMENTCTAAGVIDTVINEVDKKVNDANVELLKLKKRRVASRPKLYDLLSNLKRDNNSMKNELVDKAYQVAMGLNYAEYIIDAYNNGTEIDPDATAFIKRIMSGNITEGDKAEALNLISLTLPVSSFMIGGSISSIGAKAASKGFSILANFGANRIQSYITQNAAVNILKLSDGTIVKLPYATWVTELTDKTKGLPNASMTWGNYALGAGTGAIIGAASSVLGLAVNGEFNNVGEYDKKYITTSIIEGTLLGAASSVIGVALGPAGIGVSVVVGAFGSVIFKEIKENITGDYMADTFVDSNGNKYTIYANGSGRQGKSNKMLPKVEEATPEYTYRGVKVSESVYKKDLYQNTEEFLENQGSTGLANTYDKYQEDWYNLKRKLNGCSSAEEARYAYEQFRNDPDVDRSGFIGYVEDLNSTYGWDAEDYWRYAHDIEPTPPQVPEPEPETPPPAPEPTGPPA